MLNNSVLSTWQYTLLKFGYSLRNSIFFSFSLMTIPSMFFQWLHLIVLDNQLQQQSLLTICSNVNHLWWLLSPTKTTFGDLFQWPPPTSNSSDYFWWPALMMIIGNQLRQNPPSVTPVASLWQQSSPTACSNDHHIWRSIMVTTPHAKLIITSGNQLIWRSLMTNYSNNHY